MDVLYELPSWLYARYDNYAINGQSALLQVVKNSVESTYPSKIRADGQVIVISFNDGITFELVPAFLNTSNTYNYPDTNGSWKITDPRPEIAEMTEKKQSVE